MAISVISALLELHASIAAGAFGGVTRPPMWLDSAPQTNAAGEQVRVANGYFVIHDDGFKPTYDSSFGGTEAGQIRVEAFAIPLGAASGISVDSLVAGLKFGGYTPAQKAGFDHGAFSITGYNYKISLKRKLEKRGYAGFDIDSKRVHRCELTYAIVIGLSAT